MFTDESAKKPGRPKSQIPTQKVCPRCKLQKDVGAFGIAKKRQRPKSYCRKCESEIQKEFQKRPGQREKIAERARRRYHEISKIGKCHDCGEPVFGKGSCSACAAKRKDKEANRRAERRDGKLCPACNANLLPFARRLCDDCSSTNGARFKAYQRRWRDEQKREVMERYGGAVCACCGEREVGFLTMDHVNNDGAAHRRTMNPKHGRRRIYPWLKRYGYPGGFQVLCFNCNCGRYHNGGICPHKQAQVAA